MQPASHMADRESQQAWIILQHSLSPLVQVMHTPSLVISHLHIPIVRLQQQTIMPFIMQHQLHMPPAMAMQRFCSVPAAILSSQEHMIFMPPVHFSNLMSQRGTITQFIPVGAAGMAAPMLLIPVVGMPMLEAIIVRVIVGPPFGQTPRPLCRLLGAAPGNPYLISLELR